MMSNNEGIEFNTSMILETIASIGKFNLPSVFNQIVKNPKFK